MYEGCAWFVNNWFFGYQVYCANPTEYWLNPLGMIVATIIIICGTIKLFNDLKNRCKDEKEN